MASHMSRGLRFGLKHVKGGSKFGLAHAKGVEIWPQTCQGGSRFGLAHVEEVEQIIITQTNVMNELRGRRRVCVEGWGGVQHAVVSPVDSPLTVSLYACLVPSGKRGSARSAWRERSEGRTCNPRGTAGA